VGVQGEIGKRIFEEENISPSDFKISTIPEISLRGKLRTAMTPLKDFFVNEVAADPVDPSKHKVSMSFALYRGSYATVVLRELMKPRNLVKAGF
jgi:tRNA pseudouridine13 synthase